MPRPPTRKDVSLPTVLNRQAQFAQNRTLFLAASLVMNAPTDVLLYFYVQEPHRSVALLLL